MSENIKGTKGEVTSAGLSIRYTGKENLKGRVNKSKYFANSFDSQFGAGVSDEGTADSMLQFCDVPLEYITPRPINQYKQSRIDNLAKSIRATNNRLIHPITVARARDLDPEGEVIQSFLNSGVDIEKLQYVIICGERRFRAISQLRAEEDAKDHSFEIGWRNPFCVISCNILTPEEALNEKAFYDESNIQARQLTPDETLRHFIDAKKDVETPEQKRRMEIVMQQNGHKFYKPGTKDVIDVTEDTDPALAERMFRMDTYCVYYIAEELGINGFTPTSARDYLTVINSCSSEVIDACCNLKIPFRESRIIAKHPACLQNSLLNLWVSGKVEEYRAELKAMDLAGMKNGTKNKSIRKITKQQIDSLEKNFLKELNSNISATSRNDNETRKALIEATEKYLQELKSIIK